MREREHWEEMLDRIENALEMAEDLPDAADDFAVGVTKTLEGIRETIQDTERVTPGQESAVINIIAGMQRWLE